MKTLTTFLLSVFFIAAFAQQNPHNLVPNPSFEDIDKKRVRGAGEIELAAPWKSITGNKVDLYHQEARNKDFGVPENAYGKEAARTGKAYAGVSFFGHRGRLPRTYLGTRLTNPLVEGKVYCLKFHVSLSDLSQYAVNNLAMYISKDSLIESSEDILSYTPQIVPMPNTVYSQQYLWKEICDQYVAEGGEQHIIIGNFKSDEETTQDRVRMSRDFSGAQVRNAYYFIDDVSVIPMDQLKEGECACNLIAGGRMKVESRTFGTDAKDLDKAKETYLINSDGSMADESIRERAKSASTSEEGEGKETAASKSDWSVETTNIFFETDKFKPSAAEEKKLDKIIDYLNKNNSASIQVVGHMDATETVKFLGKRRGFMIQKKLIDAGIDKSRTSYISKESNDPLDKSDATKNKRVSFVIQ